MTHKIITIWHLNTVVIFVKTIKSNSLIKKKTTTCSHFILSCTFYKSVTIPDVIDSYRIHNIITMSPSLVDVQAWMTEYLMSTFLVLGVLGNIINIHMFTLKNFFRNSCCMYLLAASIINVFSISWGILPSLYVLDNTDPSTYSVTYCKLRPYTIHTLLMIGRSLIVFACADRYAMCARSVRLRSFCEPKSAIRIIIAHIFVWPLLTIHIAILQNYIGNKCFTSGPYILIYGVYVTIVAGTVPPVLMIIFSVLTIRYRRELRTRLNTARINNRRDDALTIMLLSQVVVYVITTSLYPAITLYRAITNGQTKSIESQQIETFVNFLGGSILVYLNPTSAFYVYFIASKNFRKECKTNFIRLYKRITRRRGRVEPRITHLT
jgi:hypothetical protein